MKYNRLLALLLALIMLFSLISCNKKNPHDNYHPDYSQQNSQHDEDQQGAEGKVTYVYSVVSKTLHLPDCYHISRMNEDYKFTFTGNISELLEKGYTICRDCLVPDDDKDDVSEEEDDTNKIAKEDATFVINKSSKTFHHLDCFRIDTMEQKNIKYTDLTLEELMELDENKPCRDCLPDAAKEYYQKHPEEDKSKK